MEKEQSKKHLSLTEEELLKVAGGTSGETEVDYLTICKNRGGWKSCSSEECTWDKASQTCVPKGSIQDGPIIGGGLSV